MDTVLLLLVQLLQWAFRLYKYILLARVLLSWIPIPYQWERIAAVIYRITEPVLSPIRSLLQRFAGNYLAMLDFSPIVAFFLLDLVQRLVMTVIYSLL